MRPPRAKRQLPPQRGPQQAWLQVPVWHWPGLVVHRWKERKDCLSGLNPMRTEPVQVQVQEQAFWRWWQLMLLQFP